MCKPLSYQICDWRISLTCALLVILWSCKISDTLLYLLLFSLSVLFILNFICSLLIACIQILTYRMTCTSQPYGICQTMCLYAAEMSNIFHCISSLHFQIEILYFFCFNLSSFCFLYWIYSLDWEIPLRHVKSLYIQVDSVVVFSGDNFAQLCNVMICNFPLHTHLHCLDVGLSGLTRWKRQILSLLLALFLCVQNCS